jgi:EAL domain-containing protein (putative c-di-GMP-specific phosphodiesterase class I)
VRTISPTPVPKMDLDGAPALVFQPAVDLFTGRLLGFEALLRWHRSDGTDIPPDVLIPWAEEHGHMNELNAWVLSEACAQAARWPSDLQLAVNCSVFQLQRGTAAMAAASALEQSGLNPDRLTVEITESSVADDDAAADLEVMTRLGIQLTMDDVGSDWSVLENLRNCVVNTMKIDASLIEGLTDKTGQGRNTVETIVKLCRSLGICTVAEAVESAEQVEILCEIGVETAQGYFFSPPMSAAEAESLAAMVPHPRFALSAPVVQ